MNRGATFRVRSSLDFDPSDLSVGDLLTISGEFKAETGISVGAQELEIHTSCSKPLAVGDIFGSLQLVGFNGLGGGSNEVTYSYLLTNNGDDVSNIDVVDDKLGTIASGISLLSGQSMNFTKL